MTLVARTVRAGPRRRRKTRRGDALVYGSPPNRATRTRNSRSALAWLPGVGETKDVAAAQRLVRKGRRAGPSPAPGYNLGVMALEGNGVAAGFHQGRRRIPPLAPNSATPTPPIRSACCIARARRRKGRRPGRLMAVDRAAQGGYRCRAGRIWRRCCSTATASPPTRPAGAKRLLRAANAAIRWRRTAWRACSFAGRGLPQDQVEAMKWHILAERRRPARRLARHANRRSSTPDERQKVEQALRKLISATVSNTE